MSVKNEHVNYATMKPEWDKCLDFVTSEKAVHAKGETYLPKLSEQDDDEYKVYKARSPVVMFAQRAGKAMTGMAGRKEPYVMGKDLVEELIDEIDADKNDLASYVAALLLRFLFTGRSATLVDVPTVNANLTVLQAEEQGIRPRFIYYREKDILNWRMERVNNINTLVFLVLREEVSEIESEFDWKPAYQYRVLDLIDGKYRVRLYDNDGVEIPNSETFPRKKGAFMTFIPVIIHGGVEPIDPPLNGIVDINKHHYQLGADEMHGLRMAALPTPYFFGCDPEDDDFPNHVGPSRVIGHSDTDAKTGFREFSGAGLQTVASKLQKFEDVIAMLSVQMTTEKANASATGSAIDYANATATLAGVVDVLSSELETALQYAADWDGINPEEIGLTLNKDFMPGGMTAQDLLAQLQLYLQGTISYSTFYKNIAKGEYADPHKTPEEEREEIEQDIPPGLNRDTGTEDNLDDDNADDGGTQ